MTVLTTCRDVTNSLDVDGVCRAEDTISETAHNSFFHVKKGHDVEKLFDLQVGDVLLNLEDTRHFRRQHVVTAPFTAAIAPLRQTHDGIGVTASGQQQMWEEGRLRAGAQRVRHQETNEQISG
jgi:hypothetical protein